MRIKVEHEQVERRVWWRVVGRDGDISKRLRERRGDVDGGLESRDEGDESVSVH